MNTKKLMALAIMLPLMQPLMAQTSKTGSLNINGRSSTPSKKTSPGQASGTLNIGGRPGQASGALHIGVSPAQEAGDTFAPPILEVIGEPVFEDADGSRAIDADESCRVLMTVRNIGMGPARGLTANISASGAVQGIHWDNKAVPDIAVGETRTVAFELQSDTFTRDGSLNLELMLKEPHGFNTDAYKMVVSTRAFKAPMVQMVDYKVLERPQAPLNKQSEFNLQVSVQNTAAGKAEDVSIDLMMPGDVIYRGGEARSLSGITLTSGESRKLTYTLIISNQFADTSLPIDIVIREKHGRYAQSGRVNLPVMQSSDSHIRIIDPTPDNPGKNIRPATLRSDVDVNIPQSRKANDNTFVLIIANSDYQMEYPVTTAANDGAVMKEYCEKTLGIPSRNIQYGTNLTKSQMEMAVEHFSQTMRLFPEARFLVFYYGHGMSTNTGDAYLLPVDGSSELLAVTGFNRKTLTDRLTENPSKSVVLFLDSCFSGTRPDGEMLHYANASSGVRLRDTWQSVSGNLVIVSASQGTQTANADPDENHNIFTYCMLKTIKETGGDITLGELFDRASMDTQRASHLKLSRSQEPTVISGTSIGEDWRKLKLK